MKRIAPTLLVFVAALSVLATPVFGQGLPTSSPDAVGLSTERLERIDKVIREYVDSNRIAGAVSLVARHGKVAHFEAYGMADIEAGTPMKTDAIFRLASMTKAITSTAVMMLYEEGHFLLSDPVAKYIPEFTDPKVLVPSEDDTSYTLEPAKSEITIRQLLNHTSGLTYGFGGHQPLADMYVAAGVSDGFYASGTIGENVRKLAKLPLLFHPGEAWEYSLSIDVLGYFVEVISGMTFDEFLRTRMFEPLSMDDTYFHPPKSKLPRLAAMYRPDGDGIEEIPDGPYDIGPSKFAADYPYNPDHRKFYSGGGGLCATISDDARFLQMMLNGGELDGVRILGRKTVEIMTRNSIGDIDIYVPNFGDKFGLGFSIIEGNEPFDGMGSPGTYMWSGAFNTVYWVDPVEDMFGLFMCQLDPWGLDIMFKFRVLATQAVDD